LESIGAGDNIGKAAGDTAAGIFEEEAALGHSWDPSHDCFRRGDIPCGPEFKIVLKVILITDFYLSIRYHYLEKTGRILV
jgi:hypothetical protein